MVPAHDAPAEPTPASSPERPRIRISQRTGFVGWIFSIDIWVTLVTFALVSGLMVSGKDAMWAVPVIFLVAGALPFYAVCLVLWLVLTRRAPSGPGRILAHALPWLALLGPASCLEPGWLRSAISQHTECGTTIRATTTISSGGGVAITWSIG